MHPNGNDAQSNEFETSRFLSSFFETARKVILSPADFYQGIRPTGSLKPPLVFAVVCGVISAPLGFLSEPLDPLVSDQSAFPWEFWELPTLTAANLALGALFVVLALVLLTLLILLGLYIGALFQHLCVMIFIRQRRPLEATLRVTGLCLRALALELDPYSRLSRNPLWRLRVYDGAQRVALYKYHASVFSSSRAHTDLAAFPLAFVPCRAFCTFASERLRR